VSDSLVVQTAKPAARCPRANVHKAEAPKRAANVQENTVSATTTDNLTALPVDDAVTRRAFRKAIVRLVPILMVAFILNYIDRTNVGFAAISMNHDIGLTNTQFGWGAGLLFIGYSGFELPSCRIMYIVGARRWLTRIMITWGIVSALTALVAGPQSYYGMRFLLGVAEAGFTPGGMFLLACWFPAYYRSRILSWFQMSVVLASTVSGPLSVAALQLNGLLGLAGWQWLFIAEGVPAAAVGFALLYLLSDRPEEASWLTPAERTAIVQALASEKRIRPVHSFWASMRDWRVLMLAGIQFGFTIGSYGVAIFLPLILKGHDLSATAIGWLAGIPYLFACVAMALWSGHVDRTGNRTGNLILTCLVGAVGLVTAVLFSSFVISFIGVCVATIGIAAARGIFWSIPPRFLAGLGSAGGLAFINTIGALGGFFGPAVMGWLKDVTGSFNAGLLIMAGLIALSAVLTLLLRITLKQE
jgi:MFS family permease